MKRFPVEYRPEAVTDIEGIFTYVLAESQNAVTAMNYTDRLYARCEIIGDVPYGGVARPDLGEGVRIVPFEKAAMILYVVEGSVVWITNVFAGGRDYEAILRDPR